MPPSSGCGIRQAPPISLPAPSASWRGRPASDSDAVTSTTRVVSGSSSESRTSQSSGRRSSCSPRWASHAQSCGEGRRLRAAVRDGARRRPERAPTGHSTSRVGRPTGPRRDPGTVRRRSARDRSPRRGTTTSPGRRRRRGRPHRWKHHAQHSPSPLREHTVVGEGTTATASHGGRQKGRCRGAAIRGCRDVSFSRVSQSLPRPRSGSDDRAQEGTYLSTGRPPASVEKHQRPAMTLSTTDHAACPLAPRAALTVCDALDSGAPASRLPVTSSANRRIRRSTHPQEEP